MRSANSMENALLGKQLQAQYIIVMRVHSHLRKSVFNRSLVREEVKKNHLIILETRSGGIRKIQ